MDANKMHELANEVESQLEDGNPVAAGLFAVALQLAGIGVALKYLGNGDASTTMGAMEALGMHLGEAINSAANTISSGLGDVALELGTLEIGLKSDE